MIYTPTASEMLSGDIEKEIEDNKPLIYWTYKTYFKTNYAFIEDELISAGYCGLLYAITNNNKSTNENEYKRYKFLCVFHRMLKCIEKERKHKDCLSINTPISNAGDPFTIESKLGNNNFEDALIIKDYIKSALVGTTQRDVNIIKEWLNGVKQVYLKKKYNLSKQSISLIITTFKNKLKKIIIENE